MKLFINRNKRTTIMRTLVFVFTFGLLCSYAYAQRAELPRLSFGVRSGGMDFVQINDRDITSWYMDNRITTVPSRTTTNDAGETVTVNSEVLIPVFITNSWFDHLGEMYGYSDPRSAYSNGVIFDEISSFSFKVYYDNRMLEFVDVQTHHPFTAEEAKDLKTTHFWDENATPNYQPPLAEHFNMTANDAAVNDYYKYFNSTDTDHNGIGRAVSITGVANSFHSLPTSDDQKILVYLKFRVKLTENYATGTLYRSPIYFDPTYVVFNGTNITKDYGHRLLRKFPANSTDPNYAFFTQDNGVFVKASHIINRNNNVQYILPTWSAAEVQTMFDAMVGVQNDYSNREAASGGYNWNEPYLPGSITVSVQQNYPKFVFEAVTPTSIKAPVEQIYKDPTDASLWVLGDIIMGDSLHRKRTTQYVNRGERVLDVTISGDEYALMENIIIETDQPWLKVRSTVMSANLANWPNASNTYFDKMQTGSQPVRRGFVQRICQLIPSNDENYNPFSNVDIKTDLPDHLALFIDCDQQNGMAPGDYTGYVTLRSPMDFYQTTRIKVRFIVVASPEEHANTAPVSAENIPFGIVLKVTPFNGTRTDLTKKLIMGSGVLAGDYADTLYGEAPAFKPLGTSRNSVANGDIMFDARFFLDGRDLVNFPRPTTSPEREQWDLLTTNGFADITHLTNAPNSATGQQVNDNGLPRADSRDIRSSLASNKSHIFNVRYAYQSDEDFYPVVVQWDTNQFQTTPMNTILLKYSKDGIINTLDMRTQGTSVGDGKFTATLLDRSIQEFWIEYTIGEEQKSDLKDNFGDDVIMPNGWNFVSLPLNPVDLHYKYSYPNAMNIPYWFSLNNWQQADNGMLQPGYGYFVKYANQVDKRFYGAAFSQINATNFPVRLYPGDEGEGGWNAIGALSTPVPTNNISFDGFGSSTPSIDYTMKQGVWAYRNKRGYEEVNTLMPGKGYWIKVNANGYLNVIKKKSIVDLPTATTNRTEGFDQITVADANQNVANLFAANNIDINNYMLPPLPPKEMFDVRYSRNNFAMNYDGAVVLMQGVEYPVSVNIANAKANYKVVDPVSGNVYGEVKAGTNGNVTINNAKSNAFKLVVGEANEAFFVNVAQNPVTTSNAVVNFGTIADGYAKIAVYNAIGNEVLTQEIGNISAGIHNTNLNVSNLSVGSYTVRLTSNNDSRVFRMNIVK